MLMPISNSYQARRRTGFAYVSLLVIISIIGIHVAAGLKLGAVTHRRDAELQLLEVGNQYRIALLSYAVATPTGQSPNPPTLQSLLRDPRFPGVVRHLRKIYADPITGDYDWQLVMTPDHSGIIGIHSRSAQHPIKIGNFDPEFQNFARKTSYQDWIFGAAL